MTVFGKYKMPLLDNTHFDWVDLQEAMPELGNPVGNPAYYKDWIDYGVVYYSTMANGGKIIGECNDIVVFTMLTEWDAKLNGRVVKMVATHPDFRRCGIATMAYLALSNDSDVYSSPALKLDGLNLWRGLHKETGRVMLHDVKTGERKPFVEDLNMYTGDIRFVLVKNSTKTLAF